MSQPEKNSEIWPSLPLEEWKDTYATLHMWTQVVGKIRLAQTPPVNHWWNVPLYVTARGLTTFSGRRAPEREGADIITGEAYSHEVISHGFWPGAGLGQPAFYSYTAPEPEGLKQERVYPEKAFYSDEMKEFLLFYDDVRNAAEPDEILMKFLQSTYEAGARLAKWDRASLER